jgi:hypothetical protein
VHVTVQVYLEDRLGRLVDLVNNVAAKALLLKTTDKRKDDGDDEAPAAMLSRNDFKYAGYARACFFHSYGLDTCLGDVVSGRLAA